MQREANALFSHKLSVMLINWHMLCKETFKCEPLHGDISQNQRERTLSASREGRFNTLVATDVAARGLDASNVDLVIHYELPNSSEIFVHRSGRTGRAGKKGSAILIHSAHQYRKIKVIEREIGCRFIEVAVLLKKCRDVQLRCGYVAHDDEMIYVPVQLDAESDAKSILSARLFGYTLVQEIVAGFMKNLGSRKRSCEISNCSSLVLIYFEEKISSLSRLMYSSSF